jgi:SAM-dependent methyltransferase
MEAVDYSDWASYLSRLVQKHKIGVSDSQEGPENSFQILDIGSGTGRFWEEWKAFPENWHYTGLDQSPEMIQVAKNKGLPRATWVCQDWNSFSSPIVKNQSGFDLVLSTHTTINYFFPLENWVRKVRNLLRKGGSLFFDFTSKRNLEENFHGKIFLEDLGDLELEWSTDFDSKSGKIEVVLDFFKKESGEHIGRERHSQFFYELPFVLEVLKGESFDILSIGGDYSHRVQPEDSYMTHILAKKR